MSDQQTSPVTPWHLWVVGGLLLIWHALAAFDFIATVIRFEPYLAGYPEDVLNYYYSAPIWMFAMWGIASLGGFVSSVLVLLRRKIAVPIFAMGWAASVVAGIYTFKNPPPQGAEMMFFIIVLLIALLVIFYLSWLSRRGVLR